MSTVSDYTSILEIGFGLNVAFNYIQIFVNPKLNDSQQKIERCQWWLQHPDEYNGLIGKKCSIEDLEDAIVDWEHEFGKLSEVAREICTARISGISA